jgi:hypothetical protein
VYRAVADAPPVVLSVVWPRRSTSLAVAAFVRAATAAAAARAPAAVLAAPADRS